MVEHVECPRCERLQKEDELCLGCGLCVRCCECTLDLPFWAVDDDLDDDGGEDDADV